MVCSVVWLRNHKFRRFKISDFFEPFTSACDSGVFGIFMLFISDFSFRNSLYEIRIQFILVLNRTLECSLVVTKIVRNYRDFDVFLIASTERSLVEIQPITDQLYFTIDQSHSRVSSKPKANFGAAMHA